jgi:hypothetical protein
MGAGRAGHEVWYHRASYWVIWQYVRPAACSTGRSHIDERILEGSYGICVCQTVNLCGIVVMQCVYVLIATSSRRQRACGPHTVLRGPLGEQREGMRPSSRKMIGLTNIMSSRPSSCQQSERSTELELANLLGRGPGCTGLHRACNRAIRSRGFEQDYQILRTPVGSSASFPYG